MEKIKLCKSFKFLGSNLDKLLNNRLREHDISITQGLALIWLAEEETGQLPIKTLEKMYGTAQSTTLGVINRLEQKNLVTTNLSEQRTKIVCVTEDGRKFVSIIEKYAMEVDELMFLDFSLGERLLFIELLNRAENNIMQQHDIN